MILQPPDPLEDTRTTGEVIDDLKDQNDSLRAQVAMLHQALHNQIYPPNLSGRSGWAELSEQARNALLNTQATAEQFIAECEQRGAVKALEDAAKGRRIYHNAADNLRGDCR